MNTGFFLWSHGVSVLAGFTVSTSGSFILFQPIYFIGEFPKVMYSAYQLKDKEIAAVDTRLEANRFYFTMNNLLNHCLNSKCNDTAVLLRYPGETLHQDNFCWVIFHDFL